jgi:hypothetical protein
MRTIALLLALTSTASAYRPRVPTPAKAPVIGRVIKIEVSAGAVIATAAVGTDQGVVRTDTCVFLEADDSPKAADCVVVRTDRRSTIVKTTMTLDQIKAGAMRVRFTAP